MIFKADSPSNAVFVGDGIFWIERDGMIEVSDDSGDVAFISLHKAPVIKGECELRIELDGLIVVGDCALQITLRDLDISPVVVSESEIRI